MTWEVLSVEADNFRSYEKLRWNLETQTGITLIVGKRNGRRSNGAGKTTGIIAILYALWKWLPPKVSAERVIRRGTDNCSIRVTIRDAQGVFTVERGYSKRGPVLNISGFDERATVAGTQRAIDSRVGDADTFLRTRMFTGATSSFCRLTDGEKKALLERMLRIDRYAKARELAGTRLRDTENALQSLQIDDLPRAESRLEAARDRRQKAAGDALLHRLRVIRRFTELRDKVFEHHASMVQAGQDLSAWVRSEDERTKAAKAAKDKAAARLIVAEQDLESMADKTAPLDKRIAVIESQIGEVRRHLQDIRSNRHPDVCTTCGQRWPSDTDPRVLAEAVEASEEKIRNMQVELFPLKKERDEIDQDIAAARAAVRAAKSDVSSISDAADNRKYRILLGVYCEAEQDVDSAVDALKRFSEESEEFPENDVLSELTAAVQEAKDEVAGVNAKIAEVTKAVESLKYWRKGFGPGGIPSYLLDSAVPQLNETASKIADALTDGELTVSFDAAATKGNQSVFKINASYAEGGESFEEASKGEQMRIDLSVLLAVADLAAGSTSTACSQLFFDEVMDGADEHFSESFVAMLRQHYPGKQVWIISHDPAIGNVCDRVMVVRKKRGVSFVAGSDAEAA